MFDKSLTQLVLRFLQCLRHIEEDVLHDHDLTRAGRRLSREPLLLMINGGPLREERAAQIRDHARSESYDRADRILLGSEYRQSPFFTNERDEDEFMREAGYLADMYRLRQAAAALLPVLARDERMPERVLREGLLDMYLVHNIHGQVPQKMRTLFAGQTRKGLLGEFLHPLVETPLHIRGFWLVDVLLRWLRASAGTAVDETAGEMSLGELEDHWQAERAREQMREASTDMAQPNMGRVTPYKDHTSSSAELQIGSQDALVLESIGHRL